MTGEHTDTEKWLHDYAFSGPDNFEEVVAAAERLGFKFVYGGATKDPDYPGVWVLLDQAEKRAERAEAERDTANDRAKMATLARKDTERYADDWKALALKAQRERDALRDALRDLEDTAGNAVGRLRVLSAAAHVEEQHGGNWENCTVTTCRIDKDRLAAVEPTLLQARALVGDDTA